MNLYLLKGIFGFDFFSTDRPKYNVDQIEAE